MKKYGKKIEGYRLGENVLEIREIKGLLWAVINGIPRYGSKQLVDVRDWLFEYAETHHNKAIITAEGFIPATEDEDKNVEIVVHLLDD